MPVRIVIDEQALRDLLTGAGGPVVQLVEDLARQVANEARRRAPVDEGRLRASIQEAVTVEPGRVVGRVGSDLDYAEYVHFGTGVYGPKRQLIYPVSRQVLSWIPRTGGMGSKTGKSKSAKDTGRVFARFVRGMPPNPFLTEALEAVSPWPVTIGDV